MTKDQRMAIAVDGKTIIMEIRMEEEVTSITTTIEISIDLTIIMEEMLLEEILLRRLHHLVLVGELKLVSHLLQEGVLGDLQSQLLLELDRGVLNLLDLGVTVVQNNLLKLLQNLVEGGEIPNLLQHQKQEELEDGEDQTLELHKKRKNKVHHLGVIQLIKIPIITA